MSLTKKLFILSLLPAISILSVWLIKQTNVDTLVFPPTVLLPDGAKYYGDTSEGKIHGSGKLVWTNGESYEGHFENGLYSGIGTLKYADGSEYHGEFSMGLFSGYGRLQYADGSVYEGQFKEGIQNGKGELTYSNKDQYIGDFERDHLHGKGKYISYENKDSFEGDFVKSKFTGSGIYEDQNGNKYIGEFDNWKFHGDGVYNTSNDRTYIGTFNNGVLNGDGSYRGPDKERYEGEFKDWMYHGKGTLTKANGDRYVGKFDYGSYHGRGTLTYAKPKNGVTEKTGIWSYGYLKNNNKKESNLYVEKALYNQRELLNAAFDRIIPSRNNYIDLYYVGIAGWGKQDVFMKEVDYAKKKFDDQFDTKGRSINLINNKKSIESTPLATVTSIEITLHAIAEKMNQSEDILFLFLTSHGTKDHKLSLEDKNISLPDLSAEKLAKIINNLPIKWKVIVVSSCYSGGFIEQLKNDNTLIMTAASADDKSFGCSDTAEMTYFGKAFFKESLALNKPFDVAFKEAEKLILEWEKDEESNSNPQIHKPDLILQHLTLWQNQMAINSLKQALLE